MSVCGLSFSTASVCVCVCVCVCVWVSECICSVFKGRLSQHAAVSGGEKVIHLSPFWFTNASLLCTFSTSLLFTPRNKRTHTTWCLINQHFRNTILSTTDQLHSDSLLITFLAPKAQFSFMQSFYALSLTHRKWSFWYCTFIVSEVKCSHIYSPHVLPNTYEILNSKKQCKWRQIQRGQN